MDPEAKKLVHDPETAVCARLIADEALSGKALVHIARLLNEHGVESARGGEWNSSSVMQLLRSPAFAGLMPQTEYEEQPDGTRKYMNRVSPYRDPETLETVSIGEGIITVGERELILRQLEARTFLLAGKRHGHKQGKSLLTGIARCGLCGARMSKAGTSYQCSNHRMGRGCSGVSARVESIDDYVTRAFLSRLPSLEPQDPLLAVIADRWVQRRTRRFSRSGTRSRRRSPTRGPVWRTWRRPGTSVASSPAQMRSTGTTGSQDDFVPGSRGCVPTCCGCRPLPWTSLLSWTRACCVKLGKPTMRPEDVNALASQSIEWKSGEAGWA